MYRNKSLTQKQLDEMWHSFIIQTRDYADFSELLGKFINHNTMSVPQASAYSNALIRYRSVFGELHPVWLSKKLHQVETYPSLNENDDCDNCKVVGWCSDND